MEEKPLLDVRSLRTEFKLNRMSSVIAIKDISFNVYKGEVVGLVGESGCGKSVTSLSIMRLLKGTPGKITGGAVYLEGQDVLKYSEKEMRSIRGKNISMIFQEPMSSLNPTMRIGAQIVENIRLHSFLNKTDAKVHTLEMLKKVGIPDAERVMRCYPHQLSGGMSQRAMIAMAMSCSPHLLIADEPTTALDVTIQAQILELMNKIKLDNSAGILLITHDLGVIAEMCSRVLVMYAGRIVEEASVEDLFVNPEHPYTRGLISCVPKIGAGVKELPFIPGAVPDLSTLPKGCKFAPRCPLVTDKCRNEEPDLFTLGDKRKSRCWFSTGKHREG
ncbi:MAG: ABC transporter ATP-binding protein [Sporolactobacillus sp.]